MDAFTHGEEKRAMPACEKPPAWRVDVYCIVKVRGRRIVKNRWGRAPPTSGCMSLDIRHQKSPILAGEIVLSRAQVVADVAVVEGLAHLGQAIRADESVMAVGRVGFAGGDTGKILATRVSPGVLSRAGHVNAAWRDASKQRMLIQGLLVLMMRIALIILAKPKGEGAADVGDMLAVRALAARE